MSRISVMFVCLGNICRSPTAHGVFRHMVATAGLADRIHIESSGTSAYHVGEPADSRACLTATKRGFAMDDLRAQQYQVDDFERFDFILAMDKDNLANLQRLQPVSSTANLALFLSYGDYPGYQEVPDPYYGGDEGFDIVLDLIENAAAGLLIEIQQLLAGR